MTHDIIRIVPANPDVAGFLWVYLNCEYGQALITRNSYGGLVGHIDDHQISQVLVPLLKDPSVQTQINRLALEANAKRTEAYHAEQKAIRITNEEVIHAAKA
jgi:type I restriction enzyme S subunit